MNIFTRKLSSLSSGTPVVITTSNGQIIQGVVAENDGSESMSLAITSTVYLRYSQIAGIEEYSSHTVLPVTVTEDKNETKVPAFSGTSEVSEDITAEKPDRMEKYVVCSKSEIRRAFKDMNPDVRKLMSQAFDKIQSGIKNHDNKKILEAEKMIWGVMENNGLVSEIAVNHFYACTCLLCEKYYSAAESFMYAEEYVRAAYVALHGAKLSRDNEMYSMAGAFAAIDIAENQYKDNLESAEVLMEASLKSGDISGVRYIVSGISTDYIKPLLNDIIGYLGEKCDYRITDFSDYDVCLDSLQKYYKSTKISEEIKNYEPEKKSVPDTEDPDLSSEGSAVPEPETVPEKPVIKEWYTGKLKSYNFFEQTGFISDSDGDTFNFELGGFDDIALKRKISKMTSLTFKEIDLVYRITNKLGKTYAVNISRYVEPAKPKDTSAVKTKNPAPVKPEAPVQVKSEDFAPVKLADAVQVKPADPVLIKPEDPDPVEKTDSTEANALYAMGLYEEAVAAALPKLSTFEFEKAFNTILLCYLALWNKDGDQGYSGKIRELLEEYEFSDFSETTLQTLQQCYFRLQDYQKSLIMLNKLMEFCDVDDHNRMLYILSQKFYCYRSIKDYQSAIGQLQEWLDIVKRYRMTERYVLRNESILISLAELYYEIEDYENAEKYALESADNDRKKALLGKLRKINDSEYDENYDEPEENEEDTDDDESKTVTLEEAYSAYKDYFGLEKLKVTDQTVKEKTDGFKDRNELYALLTWLSAVSYISSCMEYSDRSLLNDDLSMAQSVQSIEKAFSYAYNNPLSECNYTSSHVLSVFGTAQKLIPQYSAGLLTASVLRTMFAPAVGQEYYLEELMLAVEETGITEKYPALKGLMKSLKDFYDNTGLAVDSFAGYKSNSNIIDNVISEARELCVNVDSRNEVYESQGQVRRMREAMFSDEQSELRRCLNIAAENKTEEYKYVRSVMEKLFIRANRSLSVENADIMKIDSYIDKYWDIARDIIVAEKRHIARPYDHLKGSKRTNTVNAIKKIVSCVCDWLSVAEHSGNPEEKFYKQKYDESAPQIVSMLEELCNTCRSVLETEGFNWETDSLYSTACELLAKMNGTYNVRERKYLFIDFLKTENILLNDNFLPEIQSTFCGSEKMNILSRIDRHISEKKRTFEQRVSEILSDAETRHNFRSAGLIKAYAEDTGNTELAEYKEFEQLGECQKQAKRRFESMYQDFSSEMELYESYGIISDINGEKTSLLQIALDWFRITRITTDYGFYAQLIDSMKEHISVNASEHGQELMRQLEDLADKPEYNFGIYTKEYISGLIDDQNFTSVEFILNCIRRNDAESVYNYSNEPFGYFSEFVGEHATDYRAVFGAGKSIVDTIFEYSGKKDLEKALIHLTNNARKETKGGAELLRNWMAKGGPAREADLERLLSRLGFSVSSVTPEKGSGFECYRIMCHKRTGKVTYPHCIPAFGSKTETDGFRVACLYGKYDCGSLMSSFRTMNSTPANTLILLDYALNMEERRKLARKIKEEKSFSKTFIVVDRVILFYLAKHYAADTIARRLMSVTMPFAYYQPFVESSTLVMPAELFTGREAELTSIESPEGCSLVYGGRQLGKSALLKMAEHNVDRNANNDRAVLIDIQHKDYKETAVILSKELIARGILDEKCSCDNWDDLALHIRMRLMDENPETRIGYLLVMLDEADEFIGSSAKDGNPPISAIKNIPAGRFKLVMAGLHNLSRFDREMLHGDSTLIHLSSIVVKQFKRSEATKLLTYTLAYLGFRFDEKVISLILAKTNYYPGLIQFYCQKLLEAVKNDDYAGYNEISTPYYEVNEGHIKKVLSDTDFTAKVNEKLEASLFTEEKGRSYYHAIALIVAFLYYEKPADKKYTAYEIVRAAQDYRISRIMNLDREKLNEFLSEMWDLNILSKEDEYYRFATEGFRELLGSREQVESEISKYIEENDINRSNGE